MGTTLLRLKIEMLEETEKKVAYYRGSFALYRSAHVFHTFFHHLLLKNPTLLK
jgi:hypothetical protein